MPSEQLPVEQRHRDAAADYMKERGAAQYRRNNVRGGLGDGNALVQAFARFERDHMRPSPSGDDVDLSDLREAGWRVAVHNDYRLHGKDCTFWLFTHPDGRWVKGEGATDWQALRAARAAIAAKPAPSDHAAGRREGIEEAAKVAEDWQAKETDDWFWANSAIADTIRALLTEGEKS